MARQIPGEFIGPPVYSDVLPIIVERQERNRPYVHHNPPPYFAKLWRYLPMRHFENLVIQRGLFLARADAFEDKLEGTLSIKNQTARGHVYSSDERLRNVGQTLALEFKRMKSWTFVSCWRVDEDENLRSWVEYPKEPDAVAVQTNYLEISRIAACYPCASVEYVEHESTWIPEGNSVFPFFHKDKDHEWEKEFRIIDQRFPTSGRKDDTSHDCSAEPSYRGRILRADLTKLIQQVVISPNASLQCERRVRELAHEQGLVQRIRRSDLPPSFISSWS